MINILGFVLEDVAGAIVHAFRWLFAILSGLIYSLIVNVYDLFTYLSTLDFFNNEGLIGDIYRRVGLILGLFMVFKIVFSLIQSLIDPNKLTDKKNGITAIIIRSVISIVLLGLVPVIYKEAISLQNLLVGGTDSNNNIIYKLIIGKNVPKSDHFGRELAAELYFAFYRDDEAPYLVNNFDTTDPDAVFYDKKVDEIKHKVIDGKESFYYPNQFLNKQGGTNGDEYVVEYNEILSVAIGGVILWMLLMYCVQVSIRVFQLAYLRLIAPIPILSYITDPDGAFKKWLKQCTTTYIDLFIRTAIIYFVIFFSNYLVDFFNELGNDAINIFAEVFLLVGLFMFAQKVPKLLGEILPTSGGTAGFDFGLKAPKPLANVTRFGAGMALGAVGGAAANAIHGGVNTFKAFRKDENGNRNIAGGFKALGKGVLSTVGGFGGGAVQGSKIKKFSFGNVGKAVQVSNQNREKRELKAEAGYHWYRPDKVMADKVLSFAGDTTNAEKQIKTAEFRKEALQQSKSMQWQNFADTHTAEITTGDIDLSLLRSMQKFEENGRTVWRGINAAGNERTFTYNGVTNIFEAADGGTELTTGGRNDAVASKIVTDSANIDSQIKKQGKTIKGLQQADNDAKKGS